MTKPSVVSLGSAVGPRAEAFSACWESLTGARPILLAYSDFMEAPEVLQNARPAFIRLDSPHLDTESISRIAFAGQELAMENGFASGGNIDSKALAKGEIGSPASVYYGLLQIVEQIEQTHRQNVQFSTNSNVLRTAFDKTSTSQLLKHAGIPIPCALQAPSDFAHLKDIMRENSCSRVFVKLRYGSAAAGMVALARNGPDWKAVTTARRNARNRLSASRKLSTLRHESDIANLVNALIPLGVHVERWIPKLNLSGKSADLRMVVVDQKTLFPVVRASANPMTNLHLGGTRAKPDQLIEAIGIDHWNAIECTARKTAALFPSTLSLGIDIAITSGGDRHFVLEVNAFGDFIKDITVNGKSPLDLVAETILTRCVEPEFAA